MRAQAPRALRARWSHENSHDEERGSHGKKESRSHGYGKGSYDWMFGEKRCNACRECLKLIND